MNNRYILLVEDNFDDVTLALRALKKHNLANRVFVVCDGPEALNYLWGTGPYNGRDIKIMPAVILLDLMLPKMDGIEVLRRIRSEPITRGLPVVILSSSTEEQDIAACYSLGANSYICKPVDYNAFTEIVNYLGLYWLVFNQFPG
jgi:two-component system, response regulator